jgi:hypothetical protein
VRNLWEVVRRRKLTVAQLRKVGIPRLWAEAAVARARSAEVAGEPEAAAEEQHRRELQQGLEGPDRAAAARALAAVAGRAVVQVPAAGLGSSHTRELARLLNEWRPARRSVAAGR